MKGIYFILFNKAKNINENENYQFDINIREMVDFILTDNNIENEKQEETSEKQEEQSVEKEKQIEEKEEQIEENENEQIKAKNEHINRNNNNVDNELYYYENCIKKNKHTKEFFLNNNINDDISTKLLCQVLEKKVKKNKKRIKKFSIQEDTMINQLYFYNLWIGSFEKEKYKQTEEYETFIKTEFIQSSSEIK